jgi:hypothetical protein
VETMSVVTTKTRKWAVVAPLATMLLAASVAFGEAPTPCEVSYLTSGPTAEQPSLEAGCQLIA